MAMSHALKKRVYTFVLAQKCVKSFSFICGEACDRDETKWNRGTHGSLPWEMERKEDG